MKRKRQPLERDVNKKLEADVEYRKEIFEKLLEHVRGGFSMDSFSEISEGSVKNCVGRFPGEFDANMLERAVREGKHGWEKIGRDQATGKCLGNSRSWYYNMAHRYGWSDRVDARVEHSGSVAVEVVSYARPDVKPLYNETKQDER